MIPPTIVLANQSAHEASFIGYAKSVLAELKSSLSFQGLQQGTSEVSPTNGVLIEVSKHFSLETIRITVDENVYLQEEKQKELREISNLLDNRFFVRVGAPSDVELDSLGHVIRDDTRYYWIDFFYNTEASAISDQIAFYAAGERYSVVENDDTISYDEARDVSDETFLQAITMLDYMRYNVTRSFDLAIVNEQGETTKTNRWVAGYNFLSVGDAIVYAPEIPIPAGGSMDIDGISKHPPNRFVVDVETRTMCWSHALQRWPEISSYRECTGSMSGVVLAVDVGVEGAWEVSNLGDFSVTGVDAEAFGVTGTGSETVYEFQCVAADVSALDRSAVVLSLPYKSEPLSMVFDPSSDTILSCTGEDELVTSKLTATGYEWYVSSTYDRASGEQSDVPLTYSVNEEYDYGLNCSSYSAESCPSDQSELSVEIASYSEAYQAWSETHINMSVAGIDPAGWSDIFSGRDSFVEKQESVYCEIHYCCTGLYGGTMCGDCGETRGASKTMSGFMYGSFGTTQYIYAPAQNITLFLGKRDYVGAIFDAGITGPFGSTFATFEEAAAVWGQAAPCQGEGLWDVATTTYPQNYPVVDPRTYFDLSNMPIEMPELASETNPSNQTWYVPNPPSTDTTTDADLCYIDGCPDTKTQSGIVQVSILDDRWSEGSQGIVIAVKSTESGETEIYHNGVAKLSAILTALSRDMLIESGESLFDIGLI